MPKQSPTRRALRLTLLGAAAFVAATAAYVGYFYLSYQWPRDPLPSVDSAIGERSPVGPALAGVAEEAQGRLLEAIEGASMPAVSRRGRSRR